MFQNFIIGFYLELEAFPPISPSHFSSFFDTRFFRVKAMFKRFTLKCSVFHQSIHGFNTVTGVDSRLFHEFSTS